MKKNNKGLTLVSLIVTIIIILILTSIVIRSTYTGSDYKEYKLMCSDVEMLEDKCVVYYNKYGTLPVLSQVTSNLPPNNLSSPQFYTIDFSKLNGVTLNFNSADYIIDIITFQVFYIQGIEYDEVIYYTN